MRLNRNTGIFALFLALVPLALLLVCLTLSNPLPPPVVTLESRESAGIFDDSGEMWLVDLKITNTNSGDWTQKTLCVRDVKSGFEAKVTNRWVAFQESKIDCWIHPGQKHPDLLLIPSRTDLCRFTFEYTKLRATSPLKEVFYRATQHLSFSTRNRLPSVYRRWLGFGPEYVHGSHWRRMTVELSLPPPVASPNLNFPFPKSTPSSERGVPINPSIH